jgi:pilus assembly protein CpaB
LQKQKIIFIIGIFLALIAVSMVKVYIDQQRRFIGEQAKRRFTEIQANQTAVLVARVDIPKGTVVDPEMVETTIFPNQYVVPQAVTSLDRIAGMITVADIGKGEQISLSKLAQSRQAAGNLAGATPVGKRAVTISVDNIASLAGMIKPGDSVDVIAMVPIPVQTADGKESSQLATLPLFQNVLVIAVGQNIGLPVQQQLVSRYKKEETQTETSPLLTLALTAQEANLISFVQEQGKFRLVLRSPADSQIEQVQPASWDTLFQYIMPKQAAEGQEEQKQVIKQPRTVEIYRGLEKEVVPLN